MTDLFVVIHESVMSPERTDYGVASGVWDRPPVNQLAYCEGMQAEGRPGSEGRYFIARVTEIETPDPNAEATS